MAMNSENTIRREMRSLPMADEKVVTKQVRADRARVLTLEPDFPAALAGVQLRDTFTHVNGQPALDIVDFAFLSAGENVTLDVEREGIGPLHFEISKGYDSNYKWPSSLDYSQ